MRAWKKVILFNQIAWLSHVIKIIIMQSFFFVSWLAVCKYSYLCERDWMQLLSVCQKMCEDWTEQMFQLIRLWHWHWHWQWRVINSDTWVSVNFFLFLIEQKRFNSINGRESSEKFLKEREEKFSSTFKKRYG
jgi:hypothetical protein